MKVQKQTVFLSVALLCSLFSTGCGSVSLTSKSSNQAQISSYSKPVVLMNYTISNNSSKHLEQLHQIKHAIVLVNGHIAYVAVILSASAANQTNHSAIRQTDHISGNVSHYVLPKTNRTTRAISHGHYYADVHGNIINPLHTKEVVNQQLKQTITDVIKQNELHVAEVKITTNPSAYEKLRTFSPELLTQIPNQIHLELNRLF